MTTIQEMRAKYPQYNDMSDTQFADAFHGKFYSDMPKEDFYSKIGLAAPQQEMGFVDRVNSYEAENTQRLQESANRQAAGEQGGISTVWQNTGNAARLAGQIAGDAVMSGASALIPDVIERPLKDAASRGMDKLGNTYLGRTALGAVDEVKTAFSGYKQEHPAGAANYEAALDIGLAIPAARAAKGAALVGSDLAVQGGRAVAAPVIRAAETSKNALSKITSKPIATREFTPLSPDLYKQVDEMGVMAEPSVVSKMKFKLDRMAPASDSAKMAVWNDSGLPQTVKMLQDATADGKMSLSGAQTLRSSLNDKISMAYRSGDKTKARSLLEIKRTLTDAMTDPKAVNPSDYKGKNAWMMANHEFAKESLLDELVYMAEEASGRLQPANSLDTAINRFLRNENASAGLLPEERSALKAVTQQTEKGELLKAGASGLLKYAAGAKAGPPGFLVAHYGSKLMKNTAESVKLQKLDRVYDMIKNRRPPDLIPEPPTPLQITNQRRDTVTRRRAEQLGRDERAQGPIIHAEAPNIPMLPSPDKMSPLEMLSDSSGKVFPQSSKGFAEAQKTRALIDALGLSPDVTKNLSRMEARSKTAGVFDQIEKSKAVDLANELSKPTLDQMIADSDLLARLLAQETGVKFSPSAIGEALLKYKKK